MNLSETKFVSPGRLSAGVVVVRFMDHPRYLLLRAFAHWDFPKGLVEPGEAPLAAAIREVREETGLSDLVFRWGETYCETPPYGQGKVARYYLAESPTGEVQLPVSPELGHPEHHEFRWLTYDEARQLLVPRLKAILDWAHGIVTAAKTERSDGYPP
ncbi:MAG: bis(5'-nucleosyl)-tetraphosphatase [Methylohalobius sp.]